MCCKVSVNTFFGEFWACVFKIIFLGCKKFCVFYLRYKICFATVDFLVNVRIEK